MTNPGWFYSQMAAHGKTLLPLIVPTLQVRWRAAVDTPALRLRLKSVI